MAERPRRVVAVVRHREAVLVCGTDGADGARLPTASVDGGDPAAVLERLLAASAIEPAAIERRGEPVAVADADLVPFLVAAAERKAADGGPCPAPAWEPPGAVLGDTDDRWWRAYAAVAPTVETVAGDTERGSAAIATDALWALRDAAARAAAAGDGLGPVAATARALLDARPSMAALENRVNRAMADAPSPAAVEQAATAGIVRAAEADSGAAGLAAQTVDGDRVLTLSRSGTVRAALGEAAPAVVVLASRPGGEGRAFASSLADAGLEASSVPDAAVYAVLRSGEVDAVLVGADAVTADGGVVNKVGTRAAALAAECAGVPCYAVCASDKVQPAGGPTAEEPATAAPRFDWTPPRLVTALLTERGRLEPAAVPAIAEEHRRLARWRD